MAKVIILSIISVIVILLAIVSLTGSFNKVQKAQVRLDKTLVDLDSSFSEYIDICNRSDVSRYSSLIQQCNAEIMSFWNKQCVQYKDKLEICKDGGKVETYLKNAYLI